MTGRLELDGTELAQDVAYCSIKEGGPVHFLSNWINFLFSGSKVGTKRVSEETFFQDMSNGLVLCHMVQQLAPRADFWKGISLRPVAEKSCLNNLEAALVCVWRQSVAASNMCSAQDFVRAASLDLKARKAVVRCLVEIFTVLQMGRRDSRVRSHGAVLRMQELLARMGRPLSSATLSGDASALHADFASGTRVMALLIAAGKMEASRAPRLREDRHCGDDDVLWLLNGEVLNGALHQVGCPVFLAPSEWRFPPAPFPDTLQYQLLILWEFCSSGAGTPADTQFNVRAPKEDSVAYFVEFIHKHFGTFDDAFPAITQHNDDRLSRNCFYTTMQRLQYDRDAKFVWHTLDSGTHSGFTTRKIWRSLEQSVRDQHQNYALGASGTSRTDMNGSPSGQESVPASEQHANSRDRAVGDDEGLLAPTTTISVQVTLTDESQSSVQLQTSVSDAPWETQLLEDASSLLCLEIRQRAGLCCGMIDLSQVLGIEQLESSVGDNYSTSPAFVQFVVAVRPGADLHITPQASAGPPMPVTKSSMSMYHTGRGGALLLRFTAGPTPSIREAAQKFFDELRILVHFMHQSENNPLEEGGDATP